MEFPPLWLKNATCGWTFCCAMLFLDCAHSFASASERHIQTEFKAVPQKAQCTPYWRSWIYDSRLLSICTSVWLSQLPQLPDNRVKSPNNILSFSQHQLHGSYCDCDSDCNYATLNQLTILCHCFTYSARKKLFHSYSIILGACTLSLPPDWLWLLPSTIYLGLFDAWSWGMLKFDASELVHDPRVQSSRQIRPDSPDTTLTLF